MIAWNQEQFRRFALEGDQPVLVEFWAPWCVYCRRISPAMEKVAQQQEGKLMIASVNIDDEPELAEREHIEVIPTLVIYHHGERLGSITAPESRARIEEFILDTLGE